MLRNAHQKSIYNDMDEPESSARMRCVSHNSANLNESSSVKKLCSKKYLNPFSPTKNPKSQNNSLKHYIITQQHPDQNICLNDSKIFVQKKQCLSSRRALKTMDTNRNPIKKTNQKNQKKLLSCQKAIKNQSSPIQKFEQNQTKIILMRQQLEKIFQTYKQREKEIQQKKSELKNKDKIKAQNQFLSKQISRVQQMIKQALLERQKLKHAPLSKRTRR